LYSSSVSAVLILAPFILVMVVGLTVVLGGNHTENLTWWIGVTMGVGTPIAIIQDVSRYYAVASSRARLALQSDVVWLLASGSLFVLAPSFSPTVLLAIWL